VAQCVSNDVDRGAAADELDREGMSESVGVHPALDAGLPRQAFEQMSNVALVDGPTCKRAEHRSGCSEAESGASFKPCLQQRQRSNVDSEDASFISFPVLDDERLRIESNVLDAEGQGLAKPETTSEEDADQRSIAYAGRRSRRARSKNALDVCGRKEVDIEASTSSTSFRAGYRGR
jgi:hypothetical protein